MELVRRIVLFAMLWLVATPAVAQSDSERAEQLVEQATALFFEGDYAEAANLFQQAYNLDPHPVLMFNIGRAHQEMGDLPSARLFFVDALALDPDPEIRGAIEQRLGEVDQALIDQGYDPESVTADSYVPRGTLTITSSPEGATLYLDGEIVGTTPFQRSRLDVGAYDVRLTLDGYYPVATTVEVGGGRTTIRNFDLQERTALDAYEPPQPGYLTVYTAFPGFTVELDGEERGQTPFEAQGVAPGRYILTVSHEGYSSYTTEIDLEAGENLEIYARVTPLEGTRDPTRSGRRTAGLAMMGTGGAFLITGGTFGALALASGADYQNNVGAADRRDVRDRAKSQALIADIGIFSGLAIAGAGAALYFTAPETPTLDELDQFGQDQLVFTPIFGRGRVGLGLSGRF